MKKKFAPLIILIPLLASTIACSLFNNLTEDVDVVNDVIAEIEDEISPAEDVLESDAIPEIDQENELDLSITIEVPEISSSDGSMDFDTVFPLPDDVQNFIGQGGESQINFQTLLAIEDAIEFYRQAFRDDNLYERDINTTITDEAFSIVFDGHGNGQAIVIQGVDLGDGITNINIRFEDL